MASCIWAGGRTLCKNLEPSLLLIFLGLQSEKFFARFEKIFAKFLSIFLRNGLDNETLAHFKPEKNKQKLTFV